MKRSFFKDLKKFVITLRFSILSIFITFFVVTILLLISISYLHAREAMIYIANQLLKKTSSTITADLINEMTWSQEGSILSAELIQNNILHVNNEDELIKYFFKFTRNIAFAQAVYWGDEIGHYFIMERELDGRLSIRIIDPNKKPNTKIYYYNNVNDAHIIQQRTENMNYDPRQRNWYVAAKSAGKNTWTNIYPYMFNQLLGTTTATPVYDKNGKLRGVFGVDLRLDFISKFITSEVFSEHGIPFIVTVDGKLIALPEMGASPERANLNNIHSLDVKMPWIVKSYEIFKKNGQSQFSFEYNGKIYLATYTLILYDLLHDWLVGIVVPEDDFTAALKKASEIDAIVGLIVLALGVFLISKLVTRIVKPIKNLVRETNKIKNFNLSGNEKVKSRIKEVMLLADAIQSMKAGLRSFQKYVPASLVRQLIETGENAIIGGTKKTLAILFSDVKDFTQISEKMEPNELMAYICEYFDELSKIISAENGTIDKYIGDSIMAFWGAPHAIDNYCQCAARAALRITQRLNKLNKKWVESGRYPLITRIGIHTGDAIVGNVGSSERINYTAIGDAINVASRLEEINKIYGTHIVVSQEIYEIIKDQFVLRKIDCVAVKGKSEGHNIFELIAENKINHVEFDIDEYNKLFARGFLAYQQSEWDKAIVEFENCLKIFPNDSIAPVFIERCQEFKLQPPKNWDGVWRIPWK